MHITDVDDDDACCWVAWCHDSGGSSRIQAFVPCLGSNAKTSSHPSPPSSRLRDVSLFRETAAWSERSTRKMTVQLRLSLQRRLDLVRPLSPWNDAQTVTHTGVLFRGLESTECGQPPIRAHEAQE